jgi:hypothetical protein
MTTGIFDSAATAQRIRDAHTTVRAELETAQQAIRRAQQAVRDCQNVEYEVSNDGPDAYRFSGLDRSNTRIEYLVLDQTYNLLDVMQGAVSNENAAYQLRYLADAIEQAGDRTL